MILGDRLAEALPTMRAHAESMMRDACTITRAGERGAWDESTGTYAADVPVEIYSGKCRVKSRDTQSVDAGEAEWSVTDVVLSLPMAAPAPPVDAVVTITAVGPLSDPALLGARFSVVGPLSRSSMATARRLHCREVKRDA